MGQWMLLPGVDEYIAGRLVRGKILKRCAGFGGGCRSKSHVNLLDEVVNGHMNEFGNLADIEGIDFDIINKDLVDCEDWIG